MRLNRRQILQASLLGGLAGTFGGLAPAPAPSSGPLGSGLRAGGAAAARGRTLDSFELMRNAIRFGKRIQLGGHSALAETPPDDDTVLVTIKVMNHIHTPLCFKLGSLTEAYAGGDMVPLDQKFKNADVFATLSAKGVNEVSDIPRFARMRLNRWFASMLSDGRVETGAIPNVLTAADVGPFPDEGEVAFQAAVGVSQTDLSLNHSFKNCVLPVTTDPNKGGDINYHCAKQNIIHSPLGLVCLNMGGVVETTDSIGNVPNRIVTNDQVTVAALGRTVDSYVKVVSQAVGLGLVDEQLVAKFDAFIKTDSTIADELKRSRAALTAALSAMQTASAMEATPHVMTGVTAGNFQLIGTANDSVARAEFLSQCKFVQQALEIQGKPFRSFNLFCQIVDLDGAKLDTSAATPGSIAQGAEPYSYVEGMRQLAVGLNLLAQVIKKHKNVYVVVVSEGGRGAKTTDDKVSHAFVMGPGGAGNLKDFFYANMAAVESSTDPFVADPNAGKGDMTGSGQKIPTDKVVMSEAGMAIDDHMTVGGVLNGLVRHLESKRAIQNTTTGGLGKWVKIQTA